MHHIAIVSPKGGAGRTTLAANLGRLLAERTRTVLVDLDAQNALGLMLGMAPTEAHGIATPSLDHATLAGLLRAQGAEVPYLPFGRAPAAALAHLEHELVTDPSWLGKRLAALCPTGYDVAVLDTPARTSPWVTQAIALANVLLVVVEACPLSYALLPELETQLAAATKRPNGVPAPRVMFVVNRFDGRRTLSRDVRAALAHALGAQLLEVALPDDEHVREATANRTTAVRSAPHAQYSAAVRQVATLVLEALR